MPPANNAAHSLSTATSGPDRCSSSSVDKAMAGPSSEIDLGSISDGVAESTRPATACCDSSELAPCARCVDGALDSDDTRSKWRTMPESLELDPTHRRARHSTPDIRSTCSGDDSAAELAPRAAARRSARSLGDAARRTVAAIDRAGSLSIEHSSRPVSHSCQEEEGDDDGDLVEWSEGREGWRERDEVVVWLTLGLPNAHQLRYSTQSNPIPSNATCIHHQTCENVRIRCSSATDGERCSFIRSSERAPRTASSAMVLLKVHRALHPLQALPLSTPTNQPTSTPPHTLALSPTRATPRHQANEPSTIECATRSRSRRRHSPAAAAPHAPPNPTTYTYTHKPRTRWLVRRVPMA